MKTKKDTSSLILIIGFIAIAILLCVIADYIGGYKLIALLIFAGIIFRIVLAIKKHDPTKHGWYCENCGQRLSNEDVREDGAHKKCGEECMYIYFK